MVTINVETCTTVGVEQVCLRIVHINQQDKNASFRQYQRQNHTGTFTFMQIMSQVIEHLLLRMPSAYRDNTKKNEKVHVHLKYTEPCKVAAMLPLGTGCFE